MRVHPVLALRAGWNALLGRPPFTIRSLGQGARIENCEFVGHDGRGIHFEPREITVHGNRFTRGGAT